MSVLGYSQLFKGASVAGSLTRIAFTAKQVTTGQPANPTSITSDAIDTTGANLIVVLVCDYANAGGTLSDYKGNTFTLASSKQVNSLMRISVYYVPSSGIFGTNHTFTWSTGTTPCYPAIYVYAYSGATSSPYLTANSSISSSGICISFLATGSITPAVNGALLITAFSTFPCSGTGNVPTISGGGFTNSNQDQWLPNVIGRSVYSACYSIIQTSATASNPTHTFNGYGAGTVALIAAFK